MDHFVPLGHSDPLCKRVWKCKCKTTAPSGNPLFLESRKEAGTGKFMKKKVNCQPGVQAEKNQRHGKDPWQGLADGTLETSGQGSLA